MTGVTTATVETLTAEVRCLMVGSRQVTLSVYRQLDAVKFDEITPFGRVRADKTLSDATIELVGQADGILVRSVFPRPWWIETDPPTVFQHWAFHALNTLYRQEDRYVKVATRGDHTLQFLVKINAAGQATKVCGSPALRKTETGWQVAECPDVEDLEKEMLDTASERADDLALEQKLYDDYRTLPLIVLAGLK